MSDHPPDDPDTTGEAGTEADADPDADADSDTEADPTERVNAAARDAVDALDAAADASPVEQVERESDAITAFAETYGKVLADTDGTPIPSGPYAGMLADTSTVFNKTNIKSEIADAVDEHADGGKQRLDDYLRESLTEVKVTCSTDYYSPPTYAWHFDDENGTSVSTSAAKGERAHLQFHEMRNRIYGAGGPDLALPPKSLQDGEEWRDFIISLIETRKTVTKVKGPLTRAVGRIAAKIRQRTGYGTPKSARQNSGVWVPRHTPDHETPEWWGEWGRFARAESRPLDPSAVSEVRVSSKTISNIVEAEEITHDALVHELYKRGYTVDGQRSASETTYVDGDPVDFWHLDASIATPAEYVPDSYAGSETTGAAAVGADATHDRPRVLFADHDNSRDGDDGDGDGRGRARATTPIGTGAGNGSASGSDVGAGGATAPVPERLADGGGEPADESDSGGDSDDDRDDGDGDDGDGFEGVGEVR